MFKLFVKELPAGLLASLLVTMLESLMIALQGHMYSPLIMPAFFLINWLIMTAGLTLMETRRKSKNIRRS